MRDRKRDTAVAAAFTLLELLTVMAIIIVLAALIIGGVGYAQRRGATERAKAEVAALSVALESYKIDHGEYPRNDVTENLIPADPETGKIVASPDSSYPTAGIFLLASLEGNGTSNRYFEPRQDMISTTASRYLVDPFGTAYGYSTAGTFNPTFDLWSCCGVTRAGANDSPTEPIWKQWATNW